ncbi:unnamed protein product [Cunninghamella echinulata]
MLVSQQSDFTPNNNINASHRPRPTRKRTHLSASQINSLQASFNNNPLPDAAIRHRLAMTLGITERTVQIWFQNRRAKARKSDNGKINDANTTPQPFDHHQQQQQHPLHPSSSLSSLNMSSTPRYQATFRSLMTPERFEELQSSSPSSQLPTTRRRPRSASKPEPKSLDLLSNNNSNNSNNNNNNNSNINSNLRAMSEVVDHRPLDYSTTTNHPSIQTQLLTMNEDQSYFVTLPTHLLRIGTWTRFASTQPDSFDLLCTMNKKEVIYQIQSGGQQFRIQFPLSAIHQLSFNTNITGDFSLSQLDLQVDPQQLIFSMCLLNQNEWVRCGDFSEEKQASQLLIHEIQGDYTLLQQMVIEMMTCIPELASKFIVSPLLMIDDFTVSPSATPEPFNMGMNTNTPTTTHYMMDKSMMLQAPFYYSNMDPHQHHHHQQQQQLYLQQMMLM